MAEHYIDFFQMNPPKKFDRGGQVVSSTTDTQGAVTRAAKSRPKETVVEATYTLGRTGEPDFDGAIEHVEPLVSTDGSVPSEPRDAKANPIPWAGPMEYAATAANYNAQVAAMKQQVSDFDEVLSQDMKIPQRAINQIQRQFNGAAIAYHLGINRNEAVALRTMTDGEIDSYVKGLSAKIMNNGTVVSPDKMDYSEYRNWRERTRDRRV